MLLLCPVDQNYCSALEEERIRGKRQGGTCKIKPCNVQLIRIMVVLQRKGESGESGSMVLAAMGKLIWLKVA